LDAPFFSNVPFLFFRIESKGKADTQRHGFSEFQAFYRSVPREILALIEDF